MVFPSLESRASSLDSAASSLVSAATALDELDVIVAITPFTSMFDPGAAS
jgi:hypothetical protein